MWEKAKIRANAEEKCLNNLPQQELQNLQLSALDCIWTWFQSIVVGATVELFRAWSNLAHLKYVGFDADRGLGKKSYHDCIPMSYFTSQLQQYSAAHANHTTGALRLAWLCCAHSWGFGNGFVEWVSRKLISIKVSSIHNWCIFSEFQS